MSDMLDFYTPEEAWAELQARRQAYFDQYTAAFGGEHRELARTAAPGSFWRRGGKVKQHVPVAADIAAFFIFSILARLRAGARKA